MRFAVSIALFFVIVSPNAVEACSGIKGPCEAVAQAPIVFEATVRAIRSGGPDLFGGAKTIELTDIRELIGSASHTVITTCGYTRPLSESVGLRRYFESLTSRDRGARVWGRIMLDADWKRPNWPRGLPPEGARVTVRGPVQRTTTSDANGDYCFDALPAGRYTIRYRPLVRWAPGSS
jgi:hypothetical protein